MYAFFAECPAGQLVIKDLSACQWHVTTCACDHCHCADGKCSTQQSCIVLTDGRTLRFDTCVVATGSSYAEPIKPAVVSFMPHTAILTAPAGIPRSLGGAETKKCSSRSLVCPAMGIHNCMLECAVYAAASKCCHSQKQACT